jgi:Domain of unknown function (DUF4397)
MMNRSNKLLMAIAPAFLIAACGGGGEDSLDDRLGLADPKVRLVHAVPLAPNVSLFRGDVAQAGDVTNLPYKGASNYLDVSTSSAVWEVRTATTPALPVGRVTFDPSRGHKYTLLALPDAGSLTEVVLLDDPYTRGIVTDNARVRVFNAAFNAASLDIYLTVPGADLATATPTFSAVGFKQAIPASGLNASELEGGTYSLRITTAGSKTAIFTAPVTLAKNADWLLTPVPGSVTPSDVRVLVVRSDGGAASTELVNTP